MSYPTRNFALADPRTFDGNPYEVAERACRQVEGLARLLTSALETTELMARNAEFERTLATGGEPDAEAWDDGPQGKQYAYLRECTKEIERRLGLLANAAGFDPKARF